MNLKEFKVQLERFSQNETLSPEVKSKISILLIYVDLNTIQQRGTESVENKNQFLASIIEAISKEVKVETPNSEEIMSKLESAVEYFTKASLPENASQFKNTPALQSTAIAHSEGNDPITQPIQAPKVTTNYDELDRDPEVTSLLEKMGIDEKNPNNAFLFTSGTSNNEPGVRYFINQVQTALNKNKDDVYTAAIYRGFRNAYASYKDTPETSDRKGKYKEILKNYLSIPGWGYEDPLFPKLKKEDGKADEEKIRKLIASARNNLSAEVTKFEGMEGIVDKLIEIYSSYLYNLASHKEGEPMPRLQPVCFDGPPGTGKTKFLECVAKAFKMGMQTKQMGGDAETSAFTGLPQSYGNPNMAFHTEACKQSNTRHVLILLDEFEKVKEPGVIDAIGQALEVKEKHYRDKYFDTALPLYGPWIFLTTNDYSSLKEHIQSRVKKIDIPGFDHESKKKIIRNIKLPEVIKKFEEFDFKVEMSDEIIDFYLENYVTEQGARELDRDLETLAGKISSSRALEVLNLGNGDGKTFIIDQSFIESCLGEKRVSNNMKKIIALGAKFESVSKRILSPDTESFQKDTNGQLVLDDEKNPILVKKYNKAELLGSTNARLDLEEACEKAIPLFEKELSSIGENSPLYSALKERLESVKNRQQNNVPTLTELKLLSEELNRAAIGSEACNNLLKQMQKAIVKIQEYKSSIPKLKDELYLLKKTNQHQSETPNENSQETNDRTTLDIAGKEKIISYREEYIKAADQIVSEASNGNDELVKELQKLRTAIERGGHQKRPRRENAAVNTSASNSQNVEAPSTLNPLPFSKQLGDPAATSLASVRQGRPNLSTGLPSNQQYPLEQGNPPPANTAAAHPANADKGKVTSHSHTSPLTITPEAGDNQADPTAELQKRKAGDSYLSPKKTTGSVVTEADTAFWKNMHAARAMKAACKEFSTGKKSRIDQYQGTELNTAEFGKLITRFKNHTQEQSAKAEKFLNDFIRASRKVEQTIESPDPKYRDQISNSDANDLKLDYKKKLEAKQKKHVLGTDSIYFDRPIRFDDNLSGDEKKQQLLFEDDWNKHRIRQNITVDQSGNKVSILNDNQVKAESTEPFNFKFKNYDSDVGEQVIEHLAEKAAQLGRESDTEASIVLGGKGNLKALLDLARNTIASMQTVEGGGTNFKLEFKNDGTDKLIGDLKGIVKRTSDSKSSDELNKFFADHNITEEQQQVEYRQIVEKMIKLDDPNFKPRAQTSPTIWH